MISDVQIKGGWIEVYDGSGKRISTMSASSKEVAGVASDFFVVVAGGWIETYDKTCKRIITRSA
jgi:hypothetical protein